MKLIKPAFCAALLLGAIAVITQWPRLSGQAAVNTSVSKPRALATSFQLTPQVMPSSLTDIATLTGGPPAGHDVYVCYVDLATKGTASSYTIQDKQGTPVPFAFQEAIAANTTYSPMIQSGNSTNQTGNVQGCRWFPSGLSVQAGGASQVWMYMSGFYQ